MLSLRGPTLKKNSKLFIADEPMYASRPKDDFSTQNAIYVGDVGDIEASDDTPSKYNFVGQKDFNFMPKSMTTTQKDFNVMPKSLTTTDRGVNIGKNAVVKTTLKATTGADDVDVNDVCVGKDFDGHNSSGVRRFLLRSNQSRHPDDVTLPQSHQGQPKTLTHYLTDIKTSTHCLDDIKTLTPSSKYHDVIKSKYQPQDIPTSTNYLSGIQTSNSQHRNSIASKPPKTFTSTNYFDRNQVESQSEDSDESSRSVDDESAYFEVENVEKAMPINNNQMVRMKKCKIWMKIMVRK